MASSIKLPSIRKSLLNLPRPHTLQLGVAVGKTLRLTVFLLGVFIVFGEGIARQEFFQSLFLAPGIGSTHRQFEKQLGRLRRIVREEGKIDCIIIGSSTVMEGFNPALFHSSVQDTVGKDFSCYNFGVDGLTATGAGILVPILVEMYHPQIFIYGTDPRDYAVPSESMDNTTITNSPWIQYRLGKANIAGWLFDHSFLLQYQEPIREVLHLQFYNELHRYQGFPAVTNWGYLPASTNRMPVSETPGLHPGSFYVKYYTRILSNYHMLPGNLEGLEQVISQQKNGVQVLVVEMPFAPRYMDFFTHGDQDYETFIRQVSEMAESGNVPFLRSRASIAIPLDGWADYNHLNKKGTGLFSQWLGKQVAGLFLDGTASRPAP